MDKQGLEACNRPQTTHAHSCTAQMSWHSLLMSRTGTATTMTCTQPHMLTKLHDYVPSPFSTLPCAPQPSTHTEQKRMSKDTAMQSGIKGAKQWLTREQHARHTKTTCALLWVAQRGLQAHRRSACRISATALHMQWHAFDYVW